MNFRKLKEISGHAAGIYSLDFDGTYIYSASADKFVARWKIDEGVQDAFSIRFENPAYSLCLFAQKTKLAIGLGNGDLHFFDLKDRKELKFLVQHRKAIFALTENAVLNQLYAADADGNLSVWDTTSLELLAYLPFDCGKIRRIALSADGSKIALACQDGRVRILNTDNLSQISEFDAHNGGVTSVLFDQLNSNFLFTGGKDAHLKKWNLNTEECVHSIPAHNYAIYDLIALEQGEMIVSASRDKTIKIWNAETFDIIQRLDFKLGGHRHSVNSLNALNGNTFASASDDRKIILWGE
jgi:WD40 repeat protein